jgi:hypothetical protein
MNQAVSAVSVVTVTPYQEASPSSRVMLKRRRIAPISLHWE